MKREKRCSAFPTTMLVLFTCLLAFSDRLYGQTCTSQVIIQLSNIRGGIYANQPVTLKNKATGKEYKQTSNASGLVTFEVPCGQTFDVSIANYARKNEMKSPEDEGSYAKRNFSYEPNMMQQERDFAMSDAEKIAVDNAIKMLPDTTFFKNGIMSKPTVGEGNFVTYGITIKNLDGLPLAQETVVITGTKRHKSFKGKTDNAGKLSLYLPKGDEYTINFKHHPEYKKQEIAYSKGTVNGGMELSYMGTAEVERRKKIEEERIKAEEIRLKEEKRAFEKWCKERKLTLEEGYKKRLESAEFAGEDNVVTKVLNRNKWSEKLIVCDLTGSMDPYAGQLAAWYQLNYKKETNLQFIFFNDGDNKNDAEKKIGNTGGIYYQHSKGLDSLIALMSNVQAHGNGGDCPENNMEALISGVKMADPYKELVMIVDNNAPVKDLSLLKNFNKPVHIILCGSQNGGVLLDYFLIAWKTKGSIHTMEEDLTKIAGMSEGETIVVGGITYKIMGGEFVRITKT